MKNPLGVVFIISILLVTSAMGTSKAQLRNSRVQPALADEDGPDPMCPPNPIDNPHCIPW
ncbi:MAG TPA: hypothetical protein VFA71_08050 [Terriglobales bacterium]|nr:hypothetical protein [Terriglobales bacterium]